MKWINLHNHTTHSLLDGVTQIQTLIDVCKEQNIKKIAVTNHGNVINVPEIIAAGAKEDIQIIPGCEFYMCWNHSRTKKDVDNKKSYHLIGLAMNNNGWKNLMRLSSEGYLSGYYYKPRIDKELLELYGRDIIFTTACLNGVFNSKQIKENIQPLDMYEDAMWLKQILGDRLYFEIQRHPGLEEQERANCGMIQLAKKCKVPLVATCDSHYGRKEDFEAWRSIMLLQTQGKFGADALNDYYIKTEDEMIELFKDTPEAIENTVKIADRCQPVTFDKSFKFPRIDTGDLTEEQYITMKTREALLFKMPVLSPEYETYKERLKTEISILQDMGFISYMLVVADFVNAAKAKGIRVGPGRGSGCGSLVAYLLGITMIDPIKYGLIFERFLNPGRSKSPPDIDIDFDAMRRDEMKDYMVGKYGVDKVASIMTLGTQAAKMAMRDVARVKGIPYSEANLLACALPEGKRGKNVYLKEITDPNSEDYSQEFINYVNKSSKYKEIVGIAKVLEGGCKSTGTHAAGVVVSDHLPLIEHTALMLDKNKRVITQNDMKILEKQLGLIKFDFLALSTLTTLEMTKDFVKELQGIEIDIDNIPEDDAKTFDLLCTGKIEGVFQLSGSTGFQAITAKIAPRSIREIADITSLYRPGPLDNGFIPIYTRAKETGIIEYMVKVTPKELNKKIEKILLPTKGVVIYQEQILELVKTLANFSLSQADLLRRAMGKKDAEEMEQQRNLFINGCIENKIPKTEAEEIFHTIEKFAEYSFNACLAGREQFYRTSLKKNVTNYTIRELYDLKNSARLSRKDKRYSMQGKLKREGYGFTLSLHEDKRLRKNKIVDIRYQGIRDVYKITLMSGKTIRCTDNHKFPTNNGQKQTKDLVIGHDFLYINAGYEVNQNSFRFGKKDNLPKKGQQGFQKLNYSVTRDYLEKRDRLILSHSFCQCCSIELTRKEIHHKDGDHGNQDLSNLEVLCPGCHKKKHYKMGRVKKGEKGLLSELDAIVSITPDGKEDVYDIEMARPFHNFLTNEGIITSNSHAIAYSIITYQTAYLKAHYLKEFIAALLNEYIGDNEKIIPILQDCRESGIKILPPDINESSMVFAPTEGGIRFGFSAIKGFGDVASTCLVEERKKNGRFLNFLDFISRCNLTKINKAKLKSLIESGCFDKSSPFNRKEMTEYLSDFMEASNAKKALFFIPSLKDYSFEEKCFMEYGYVGYFISGHPLEVYKNNLSTCIPLSECKDLSKGELVTIGGIVTSIKIIKTKKNELMAKIWLEDLRGQIQAIIFPKTYKDCSTLLKMGEKIVIEGKISTDSSNEILTREVISSKIRLLDQPLEDQMIVHIDEQSDLEGIKSLLNSKNMGRKIHLRYKNMTFPLKQRFLPTPLALEMLKTKGVKIQ